MSKERVNFGSKLGMVLATAGSAVGLGNVWRFPYMTGQNGGAVFIMVYIGCVVLLGLPCMMSEFIIGRHGAANTGRAYGKMGAHSLWRLVGCMSVLTGFLITGYYAVVSGWCLQYIFSSAFGELNGNPTYITEYFKDFSSAPLQPVIWTVAILAMTHFVIIHGVRSGIERASKIMMPLLFILLLVVVVGSCMLPGAGKGIEFLFRPDFSKLDSNMFLAAMGQSFYSLSIGMGCIITLPNVFREAFASMPILGTIIATGFYILLSLAALTSLISLHEVSTAFFYEELHTTRKKAATIVTVSCCIMGAFCSLSIGGRDWLMIGGKSLFDVFDFVTGQIFLPIVGFLTCLFLGWVVPRKTVKDEFTNWGTLRSTLFGVYMVLIRYVCPVCIVAIFLNQLGVI